MANEWKSMSEGREKPVALPMPSTNAENSKAVKGGDTLSDTPQWGHGKYFGAGEDPSTHESEPRGSGWSSKSESYKPDMKGHTK